MSKKNNFITLNYSYIMKNLIFLLSLSILTSCVDSNKVVISKAEYNQLKGIPQAEYPKIITIPRNWGDLEFDVSCIDSCEYFTYNLASNVGIMCHKGNCKFCQQRLQQTIHKIIQEGTQKN